MKFDTILNATIRRDSFLVPKEMIIDGSFRAEVAGQIAGVVNGEVSCKARIIILKDGIINGNIIVDELLVYGRVNGNMISCNKITVQSGAMIKANISTTEIHIEKGALIEGLITKSGVPLIIPKRTETTRKKEDISEKFDSPARERDEIEQRQSWF